MFPEIVLKDPVEVRQPIYADTLDDVHTVSMFLSQLYKANDPLVVPTIDGLAGRIYTERSVFGSLDGDGDHFIAEDCLAAFIVDNPDGWIRVNPINGESQYGANFWEYQLNGEVIRESPDQLAQRVFDYYKSSFKASNEMLDRSVGAYGSGKDTLVLTRSHILN